MKKSFYFIVLSLLVMLVNSCGEKNTEEGTTTSLTIKIDKQIVQAASEDFVKVEVYDEANTLITEGLTFYDKKGKVLDLPDGKFRPQTAGVYEFFAFYAGAWSETVSVKAIDFPVPSLPEDTELPENSAFAKKVMAIQFTSTGCIACPTMKKVIKKAIEDQEFSDRIITVSSHHDMSGYQYGDDPASYPGNDDFMNALGVKGYPTLVLNLGTTFSFFQNESQFKSIVNEIYGNGLSAVGIAVNSNASDKGLVARVLVKTVLDSDDPIRISACLIEDGIYGPQNNAPSNDPEWSTHNNCIRMLDCNKKAGYAGYSLGRMKGGESKEYTFVFDNSSNLVNMDNCKLLFYITCSGSLQNAVLVPVGQEVGFDYVSTIG